MIFKKRAQIDVDGSEAARYAGAGKTKAGGQSSSTRTSADPALASPEMMLDAPAIKRVVKDPSLASSEIQSVVSVEACWEGRLRTEGSARIDGKSSGEIEAGQTIFISKGAQVRANINARKVVVAGELEGEINCRDQLVVEKTGRLGGKVATKTLVIEEGAVVFSQIEMLVTSDPVEDAATRLSATADYALSAGRSA